MADIVLSNGREITFNLELLTLREFRLLFDKSQPQETEDVILSKVCGMTADEYRDLPYMEWRRLTFNLFKRLRDPLSDPNA